MRQMVMSGLAVLCWVGVATAQPPTDDKSTVTFDTFDHVRLSGTFLKGTKGIDSPAVMMIHRFNSDRSAKGWESLATHLRDKLGCSVLTFDLRGHGGSKSVQNKFWTFEHNKNGIRGGTAPKTKSEINASEFKGSYWSVLMNDLAAARHFLDQQNDAQLCNSSSIIVIGAQEGAGLGMGWISYEWDRRVVPLGTSALSLTPTGHTPGEDIAAGVWLGPSARGGSVNFKAAEWFGKNGKLREATPMYFLYGKDDPNASMVAGVMAALKKPPEGVKNKHTFDKDEKLNTKLPGQELADKLSDEVNKKVADYIENLLKNHRKNVGWKAMNAAPPTLFPIGALGFQPPN